MITQQHCHRRPFDIGIEHMQVVQTEVKKYVVNCINNVTTNIFGYLKRWATYQLTKELAKVDGKLLERLNNDRRVR